MAKDSIYDEVGGCTECPYVDECVVLSDCAGYTMNDEHGVCPEELVKRHMIAVAGVREHLEEMSGELG